MTGSGTGKPRFFGTDIGLSDFPGAYPCTKTAPGHIRVPKLAPPPEGGKSGGYSTGTVGSSGKGSPRARLLPGAAPCGYRPICWTPNRKNGLK